MVCLEQCHPVNALLLPFSLLPRHFLTALQYIDPREQWIAAHQEGCPHCKSYICVWQWERSSGQMVSTTRSFLVSFEG
jgi:hypothetical protein